MANAPSTWNNCVARIARRRGARFIQYSRINSRLAIAMPAFIPSRK
jgi:hypothetical protein